MRNAAMTIEMDRLPKTLRAINYSGAENLHIGAQLYMSVAAETIAVAQEICDAPLEAGWIPGQTTGYHVASGCYILGGIVRRVDGCPYSRYVRESIFEPLGMSDSWLGMPSEKHRKYLGLGSP